VVPLDPTLLNRDDVRAALAARDISAVYRVLWQSGVSQRQIAQLTRQSQSEVSEILKGRQVRDVRVLERIADGLAIPRAWMSLGYGEKAPDETPANEEIDEEMKRRALLASTAAAAMGQVIPGLGKPIKLTRPTATPLPSRLGMSHVHTVRAATEQLRSMARYYGGQADLFGAAAELYTQWMEVPATDKIKTQLGAALAELHTEAGWCCYDSGLDGTGHFTHALQLAGDAKDTYGIANAAFVAGGTLVRTGHPNDALKLFQLAQWRLGPPAQHTSDPRLPTVIAGLNLNSATAYALLNSPAQANRYLTQAHDGWEPQDAFQRASMDRATAGIQLDLGQLDTAEHYAANAVRTYGEGHRKDRTTAELILAEAHIRAGEPQGLALAHHAINEVSTLHSIAVRRQRLIPLATALEAQPGTDTQQLARKARQIATTRI
jgi:transcriptional regulator with XRE-family HTH domain